MCAAWPDGGRPALAPAPLPDIPALLLSGAQDAVTPTLIARAVAREFKQSRLVVIHGMGHGIVFGSVCAASLVAAWMAGHNHDGCAAVHANPPPLQAFPAATATDEMSSALGTLLEVESTAALMPAQTVMPGLSGGSS
jgi:hypothetical protein